jgi:hypothetical protein
VQLVHKVFKEKQDFQVFKVLKGIREIKVKLVQQD